LSIAFGLLNILVSEQSAIYIIWHKILSGVYLVQYLLYANVEVHSADWRQMWELVSLNFRIFCKVFRSMSDLDLVLVLISGWLSGVNLNPHQRLPLFLWAKKLYPHC